MLMGALVALFLSLAPASWIATITGHECERGCIVGETGWVYEVTRDDLVILARAANCEVKDAIGTADADAAMWALTSNFVRRKLVGRPETLARFVMGYSACTGIKWSSAGWERNDRITPRADANRQLRWRDIPQRVRDYVRAFLRNERPNRMPGVVYVLTAGFERHAHPLWIGPLYAETRGPGSFNAYWRDQSTAAWTDRTVRIAPATGGDAP